MVPWDKSLLCPNQRLKKRNSSKEQSLSIEKRANQTTTTNWVFNVLLLSWIKTKIDQQFSSPTGKLIYGYGSTKNKHLHLVVVCIYSV
jgi:hypothetical protein